VEQKQTAHQGMTCAEHEAKQIENPARGKGERIKIMATVEAKALRLVGAALADNLRSLTYRYIEPLSPKLGIMILRQG
jgi:hypothetical protein